MNRFVFPALANARDGAMSVLADLGGVILTEDTLHEAAGKKPLFFAILGEKSMKEGQNLAEDLEGKYGIPAVYIKASTEDSYEIGEEAAWSVIYDLAVRVIYGEDEPDEYEGTIPLIGIWGATTLNFLKGENWMTLRDKAENFLFYLYISKVYGREGGLKVIADAGNAERNQVVSPAGIAPAVMMKQRFGIPYEIGYPISEVWLGKLISDLQEAAGDGLKDENIRILVCHQQVLANSIREQLELKIPYLKGKIHVASLFPMNRMLKKEGDFYISNTDEWQEAMGNYGVVLGDPALKPGESQGIFIELDHEAVSSK